MNLVLPLRICRFGEALRSRHEPPSRLKTDLSDVLLFGDFSTLDHQGITV